MTLDEQIAQAEREAAAQGKDIKAIKDSIFGSENIAYGTPKKIDIGDGFGIGKMEVDTTQGSLVDRMHAGFQGIASDIDLTTNKALQAMGVNSIMGVPLTKLNKDANARLDREQKTVTDYKAEGIKNTGEEPYDIAGAATRLSPYLIGGALGGAGKTILGTVAKDFVVTTPVTILEHGHKDNAVEEIGKNTALNAAFAGTGHVVFDALGKGAKAIFSKTDTKIDTKAKIDTDTLPAEDIKTPKIDSTDESVAKGAWNNFKGKKIDPNLQQSIIEDAKKGLGTKYVWGGESCKGWDCSGYVQNIFKNNGIDLPRRANEQFKVGHNIAKEELQAGDLVFFNNGKRKGLDATHVGIYMGNGKILNAKNKDTGTVISNISDFGKQYVGARRIVGNTDIQTPHIADDVEAPKVDVKETTEVASKTAAQKLDDTVKANEESAKKIANEYDHDVIDDVLRSQEKLKNIGSNDYDQIVEDTYKKAKEIKQSIKTDAADAISPSTQLYRNMRDSEVEDPVANMDLISSRADAMGMDVDTLLAQKPVLVKQVETPNFQEGMGKTYSDMNFDELVQHPRYQELIAARKDIAADKTKYDNIQVQKPASYYNGNDLIVQGGEYTRNFDADFRLTKADITAIQKGKVTPEITQKLRSDLGRLDSDPTYNTTAAQKDGNTIKGKIDFTNSKAVITLFKDADVTTLPHELGHYFRQTLSTNETAEAERIFGVKNSIWDDAAEERFANGFVSFLETGEAPTQILKNVFEKFKNWIKELWDNAYYRSDDKDFVLNNEHKLFFRAILGDKEAAAKLWGDSAGKSVENESKTLYSIASFGLNHPQFKGKPQEAIDFLMKNKKGQVVGAINHPDVGDIDFVYGDTNRGLKHIFDRRLEQWGDEDKVKRFMSHIPDIIKESKIDKKASTQNRIVLRSPKSTIILDNGLYGKDKVWMLSGWVEHKNKKLHLTSETIDSGDSQIRADSSDRQANLTEPVLSNDTTIPQNTNDVKSIYNKGTFDPYDPKILDQAVSIGKNKNITIDDIKETLGNHRGVYEDIPYTKENWDKVFPNGKVQTPLGEIEMGGNQFEKLNPNIVDPKNTDRIKQDRRGHLSYIEQTLKDPAIAVEKNESRGKVLVYIKEFDTQNGVKQYSSIIIDKDGINVSISSHPLNYKQIKSEIEKGDVKGVYPKEVTANKPTNPYSTSDFVENTTIPQNTNDVKFEPKSLSQETQNDLKQKIADIDRQIDDLSKANESIAYAKRRIDELSRNKKQSALTLRALEKNKTNLEVLEDRTGITKLKQEKAKLLGQKYESDIHIATQYGGWIRNKFDSILSFFANKPLIQNIVNSDLYNSTISLHNLKKEKAYNFQKEDLNIHINELRTGLEELYHGLSSMSMDARVAMYRYMTGEKVEIPDALKTVADDMRKEIDELGAKLVNEGILDQKTYDTWKATYLHRLYQPKMTRSSISKMFKDAVSIEQIFERGKKTIFKPEEIGDIKEYMYSAWYDWKKLDYANTLDDLMDISKDKSIAEGGIELTQTANGKIKARIDYTKAERAAMGEVEDIAVVLPQTLLKLHTMVYHSEFLRSLPGNVIGDAKKFSEQELKDAGFIKLTGLKYGFLNGKWVKKEIAKDIVYTQKQYFGEENSLLKLYDTYHTALKKSVTVWDPRGHFNNFFGNFMFQAGAGIPPHESIKNVALGMKAANKIERFIELRSKSKVRSLGADENKELAAMMRDKDLSLWYELRAKGAFGRSGLNDILQKSIATTEDITHDRGKIQGVTDAAYREYKFLDDKVSKYYGLEDDFHRFAMAKYFIEKNGLNIEEAMHEVNKNLPDYSASMTTFGGFLRRTVAPFFSFTYHATPIMLRQMYEHPKVVGTTLAAMLSFYAINDINPFDPEETPKGYGFRRIPIFKDGDKVQTLKLDKVIPHMDLLNWLPFTNDKNPIIPENLRTLAIGGFPMSAIGWENNYNFYFGNPITRQEGAEGSYQLNVKYPIQKLLPTPGILDSLWDLAESNYKDEKKRRNDDTTDPRSSIQEFFKIVGVNTMTYDLDRLKERTQKENLKDNK